MTASTTGESCRMIPYRITFLEMTSPPKGPPPVAPDGYRLRHETEPGAELFRSLYDGVGADFEWNDFHYLAPEEVEEYACDPLIELYLLLDSRGETAGFFQLDRRQERSAGCVELALFGLFPSHRGKGVGRWALGEAQRIAWRSGVVKLEVNTCTLDHPAALPLYRSCGFVPVRVEDHERPAGSAGWRR